MHVLYFLKEGHEGTKIQHYLGHTFSRLVMLFHTNSYTSNKAKQGNISRQSHLRRKKELLRQDSNTRLMKHMLSCSISGVGRCLWLGDGEDTNCNCTIVLLH